MSKSALPDILSRVSPLLDKLPFSFMKQLDEWAGDAVRERRLRRLAEILSEAHEIAKQRGLPVESMQTLADHVGLPWVDKASLQDNADLREAWANLFVSMATDEADFHATYVSILGEMTPVDCKVLAHVVTHGLALTADRNLALLPMPDADIHRAMSATGHDEGRVQISIESLIRQACLIRSLPAPLKADVSMYGGLPEVISATTLGINFFSAASGSDLFSLAPVLSEEQIKERRGIVETTSRGHTAPAVALASTIRVV